MERWKDIEGYEGLYQISDKGRVKSLERVVISKVGNKRLIPSCILKPWDNLKGYDKVILYRDGLKKRVFVHRLVARSFVDGETNKYNQINHKNGNKKDNRAENLEWCDSTINNRHAYDDLGNKNRRITDPLKSAILDLFEKNKSTSYIVKTTGFSKSQINAFLVIKRLEKENKLIFKIFDYKANCHSISFISQELSIPESRVKKYIQNGNSIIRKNNVRIELIRKIKNMHKLGYSSKEIASFLNLNHSNTQRHTQAID